MSLTASQVLSMMETMAQNGTAPEEGCSLFGVGYNTAFEQLRTRVIHQQFQRGRSTEKFVVGPFGSGKSHFLHQLFELAHEENCVTAKVTLNKNVDFTRYMLVFREMTHEIRAPHSHRHGIRALIQEAVAFKRMQVPDNPTASELLLRGWISALTDFDYKWSIYGQMLRSACIACVEEQEDRFELLCRWLGGEMDNPEIVRTLKAPKITNAEANMTALRSLHTLAQFVRQTGWKGTVVGFDEAEQGFNVDTRKKQRILSMLMADINATNSLQNGSLMMVYALTPDIVKDFDSFPALQQRVQHPGADFFDGNAWAPLIDLQRRPDRENELVEISTRLVNLMYLHWAKDMDYPEEEAITLAQTIACRLASEDLSSSVRRTLVKEICTMLISAYDSGYIYAAEGQKIEAEV
ncbi:BREX system ATP-binding domain-containing protein [Paenibacillus roseipurpureus]|uniref:DUF2791 family P-loop domain-containing protein n=1 Tax=Paenibacillus roseopurpureus TaxID=2918901 RepID=A0AA96LNS4_9BACL|nr:BREX system ATP-binding domain-containing protein [Paenibacillus sp. MBLB1832]WNR45150.1 DUF2791 family P-loop domain-containing protein [Paenibacillus sp. MBLB1832]